MKPKRYKEGQKNPAVEGNLSIEDIVRLDWEREYKGTDVELDDVRVRMNEFINQGGLVARLRNTLFLYTPLEDNFEEVLFDITTADTTEVCESFIIRFFLGLNEDKGTTTLYTFADDKSTYKIMRKLFTDEFVDMEETNDPELRGVGITIDLEGYVDYVKANQNQQNAGAEG